MVTETPDRDELPEETFYQAVCTREDCEVGVMAPRQHKSEAERDGEIHLEKSDATHTFGIVDYEARTWGLTPLGEDKPPEAKLLQQAKEQ